MRLIRKICLARLNSMRKITAEVVMDSYCSTQYDVRNELGEPSSRADLALSFCEVDEKC